MVLPRVAAFRSVLRAQSVRAPRTPTFSQFTRQIGRRSYATEGGHHTKQASSDLPWAVGAAVVTLPSVFYLISSGESHGIAPAKVVKPQGHGHGHEEPSEESEGSEEVQSEPEPEPEPESAPEPESSESESEGEGQDTPDTSDDDSSDDKSGTKEHLDDAKGVGKKRINSSLAKSQGADEPTQEPEGRSSEDKPATSKPVVKGEMSGKQAGLTTTDTKHSTDITNDPNKSKKGEGVPETAKVKGTVSPDRPQV
ncbi:MAG: hypothetical protein M1819_000441 [Sarea resinae]|nr:MAG: hypothetical protein M1819_000441 [Sarea resinae]